MLLDFLNPVLDPRITFSRGTNATLVDSTGRITYAPSNVMLRSEEFDDIATWPTVIAGLGVAPVRTANFATAPDGTQTADRLQFNLGGGTAGADQSRIQQGNMPVISGQTYIASIYVKLNTGSSAVISLQHSGAATTSFTVTDQWQRISLSGAVAVTLANFFIGLRGGQFPANSNTIDLLVWGGQYEPVTYQTTPSPYVATTASAYYGPRFDYDPVTLAPRGLLIEEARTNLVLRSEEFDNAAWLKTASSIPLTNGVSPAGTATADVLREDATNNTHIVQQSPAAAASTAYTAHVYFKREVGTRNAYIQANNNTTGTGGACFAWFDLQAGTASAVTNLVAGFTSTSAAITNAGNGWYRCSMTFTTAADTSSLAISYGTYNAARSYAGDGTSGIYLWGAQLEAGAFATSYIPTVASTVSRSADVATMTGTNFSSWYNQSEGTFVSDFDKYSTTTRGGILCAGNISGASANGITLDGQNDGKVRAFIETAGVVEMANVTLANYAANTPIKGAIAYATNNAVGAAAGALGTVDTSVIVPTVDNLQIGAVRNNTVPASVPLNGHIRAIAYYNTRLPNAQLQTLTAPSLATTLALDFTSGSYNVGF
jgi:hypothetical protein